MTPARRLGILVLAAWLAAPAPVFAQGRGQSGMPPGPGNPFAALQQQIDALAQRLDALERGTPVALTVACPGQTIGDALASAPAGAPLTLTVSGVCTENVVVMRDDVAMLGAGAGATVVAADASLPAILLEGARRVTLDRVSTSGGAGGVVGVRGAVFTLSNASVTGATRFGVLASFGSTGTAANVLVSGIVGEGVIAANDSVLAVVDSTVENNTGSGMVASRGSHLRVGQDLTGALVARPVTVQNNGASGIQIADSSAGIVVATTVQGHPNGTGIGVSGSSAARIGAVPGLVAPNTITNSRTGISVFQSSQAFIQGNTISVSVNGIALTGAASATILGNAISASSDKGITLSETSTARIGVADNGVTVLGNTVQTSVRDGIGVFTGSSAVLAGNTVTTSGRFGVNVDRATARMVGQNWITGNSGHGVYVANSGSLFQGQGDFAVASSFDRVESNGQHGINAFNGASVYLSNARLAGNAGRGLSLFLGSSAWVTNLTVMANTQVGVGVAGASLFATAAPPANLVVTANGTGGLVCFDGTSRAAGDFSGISGNGGPQVSCSGF